jgi:phosphatidylinositol phospholipase C, delta
MVAAKIKERQIKEQEKEGQYKLRTRASKGSDPDFAGEELHFSVVPGVVSELVFVRFVVRAEERLQRDLLVGWSCVRLDRLRQGYRFVHLLDDKGMQTDAVLLVKVTKMLK